MFNLKRFTIAVSMLVLVIVLIYGIAFVSSQITGRISLDLESKYVQGEPLKGTLKISLKEGELIPASSKILFENNGQSYEYDLSSLISEQQTSGNFYVEGKSLSGSGYGYGIVGEYIDYPIIQFKLDILSNSGFEVEEKNETSNTNPETNESEEEIKTTSKITGLTTVGSAILSIEKEIDGSVVYGEEFTYELEEGQSVEVVSGSVKTNSESLGDSAITLKKDGNRIIVSTDYFEEGEGYGEKYLGKIAKEITIDLSETNFNPSPGSLDVSLVYEGEKYITLSANLVEGQETIEKEETILENITENTIKEENLSLTEEEKIILQSAFGSDPIKITSAEKTDEAIIVRFEIGSYWVENYYDPFIRKDVLELQVEQDRIKFLKDLADKFSKEQKQTETISELIGSYGI